MAKKSRHERWHFPCELFSYFASDGLILNGLLARSRKVNKRVIINVFGMTSDFFASNRYPVFHDVLRGSDTDIFFANNRGFGSVTRFKRRNKEDVFAGTALEKFEDCVFDIKGAMDLLASLGYKDIILQGHSTGAQKVAYYQYKRRDRRVKGIILLSPSDDYNLAKRNLGRRFNKAVKLAKTMVAHRKGHLMTPAWISYYSASRFLSYADPKNAEARLFDYEGLMREFSRISVPVLAVFGSREQCASKSVRECLDILKRKTGSGDYEGVIVKGGDHSFRRREEELALLIAGWSSRVCP